LFRAGPSIEGSRTLLAGYWVNMPPGVAAAGHGASGRRLMTEEAFTGGRFADPARDGDTVVRRAGPAAANIHALLDHLAGRGFTLAPRAVSTGPDGREVLTFLPGAAAHPPLSAAVRSERACVVPAGPFALSTTLAR
jgi:hypothetical protein